jgi:hypothetical protein
MFHGLLARDCQILAFHVGLALTTGICQSPPSEHDIVKLLSLMVAELSKLAPLLEGMVSLSGGGTQLSDQQMTVILQNLFNKTLTQIQADKGGIVVEFTGGGYEYERFLVRADGRVPNSRYEAKAVKREV